MLTNDEVHKMHALEHAHWWFQGTRESCFGMLEPYLADRRALRILDVGCGTGGNIERLQQWGTTQGIDLDPLCVDYCRKKGLDVTVGSLTDLHVPPASFDLITIFDALTYATKEETVRVLRDMRDALVPGGILAFREPAMPIAAGAHDNATQLKQRFTKPAVDAALRAAGFEPLRITYLNTLLFPLIVLKRRLQMLGNPTLAKSDVEETPEPFNSLLLGVLRLEHALLRATDLPFGVSLFAIARKPT